MTSYKLHFFNRSVVLLKALHSAVAVAGGGDALHGVVGTGERRDVRNLVVDACGVRTAVRSYKNASIFVRHSPCVLLMAALRIALWSLRLPNAGLGNRLASNPASLALGICRP